MSVRNSGHYIETKIDEFFHNSDEIGENMVSKPKDEVEENQERLEGPYQGWNTNPN